MMSLVISFIASGNQLIIHMNTLSRGLLLLSFAEHKVISRNSSIHNLVASGMFLQDCIIV